MKSITACPHCQTQFLVTDEQLSQYNGKVRCGHCLNVFNAVDYIVPAAESAVDTSNDQKDEITEVTSEAAEHSESIEEVAEINDAVENPQVSEVENSVLEMPNLEASSFEALVIETESPETATLEMHSVEITDFETSSPQISNTEISNLETSIPEASNPIVDATDFPNASSSIDEVLEAIGKQTDFNFDHHLEASDASATFMAANANSAIDAGELHDEISKINEFDYKPEYQYYLDQKKPTSPALLVIGSMLILVAIVQCIFFYRHTIAMELPAAKPVLETICAQLGCKINLPKEINLFSIDDSGIEEDFNYQGVIRLTSTLTNRANFNQAYPNLEVTLTDTQDAPKLRRVFKPTEYLPKETNFELGVPAGESIAINMPLMTDDVKAAGFRLLVSY